MNKRQRKKWLKVQGKYVNPREVWNLDDTLAKYIVPRLELLKKTTHSYPGREEANTPEKWYEILDKMILAFQLVQDDDWEFRYFKDPYNEDREEFYTELTSRNEKIEEGLQLFAKWFRDLWD